MVFTCRKTSNVKMKPYVGLHTMTKNHSADTPSDTAQTSDSIHRRRFIKSLGVTGGAAAFGGIENVTAKANSQRDTIDPNDTKAVEKVDWARRYGKSGTGDLATAVLPTDDRGIIVTGATKSYGETGFDAWLFKTDETGDVVWNRVHTGYPGYDSPQALIKTADGGFALAGWTRQPTEDDNSVLVVKTDPTGHEQWRQRYHFETEAEATDLLQTADGGYLVVGPWAIGSQALAIKLAGDGTEQWRQLYGEVGGERGLGDTIRETATAVVPAHDEGYLIAGSVEFDENKSNLNLVQIDETGTAVWSHELDLSIRDTTHAFVRTADGYTLAGKTCGKGSDGLLVHLDANKNVVWQHAYSETIGDQFENLITTSDGGYLTGGTTSGKGWFVKTTGEGTIKWEQTVSQPGFSLNGGVAETTDGGYVLVGSGRSRTGDPDLRDAVIAKVQ
jgi:hypothetical protein